MQPKQLTYFIFFFLGCSFYSLQAISQNDYFKLGPNSFTNRFVTDAVTSHNVNSHRFTPLHDKTSVYTKFGERLYLTLSDTIVADQVFTGKWDGKNGKWILFYAALGNHNTSDYFVFMDEMKDVQPIFDKIEQQKAVIDARSAKAMSSVFLEFVVPLLLLLFSTIYFFRKFYYRVSGVFAVVSGNMSAALIGLILMSLAGYVFYFGYAAEHFGRGEENFNKLYMLLGVDRLMNRTADFSTLSFGQTFYYEGMTTLIGMAILFFEWIGIGFFLAGIVALFTSGSPATAQGTSSDGGRTIYIHSITPASGSNDVDLSVVVQFWLIYSIVFPLMYYFAYELWPSTTNTFRPLFIGLVLTSVITIVYKILDKKGHPLTRFLSKFALSFLGFAVTIVLVVVIAIVVKLIVAALMG